MPAGNVVTAQTFIGHYVENYVRLREIRVPRHVKVARL